MRHIGGESMDSELFELDNLGILRTTHLPSKLQSLKDKELETTLLIELLGAGEEGLTRRHILKHKQAGEDAAQWLTLRDLAEWQRDRFGKLTFLVITWKGEKMARNLLSVCKHSSHLLKSSDKEDAVQAHD